MNKEEVLKVIHTVYDALINEDLSYGAVLNYVNTELQTFITYEEGTALLTLNNMLSDWKELPPDMSDFTDEDAEQFGKILERVFRDLPKDGEDFEE